MYAQLPSSLSIAPDKDSVCLCLSHQEERTSLESLFPGFSPRGAGGWRETFHLILFYGDDTAAKRRKRRRSASCSVRSIETRAHLCRLYRFLVFLFVIFERADSNLKIQLIYIITVESESNSLISNGNGINVQIGRRHRWIYVSFAASTVVFFLIGKENKEEEQTTERQQKLKRK